VLLIVFSLTSGNEYRFLFLIASPVLLLASNADVANRLPKNPQFLQFSGSALLSGADDVCLAGVEAQSSSLSPVRKVRAWQKAIIDT